MDNHLKDIVDLTNRNNYKLAIVKLCEFVNQLGIDLKELRSQLESETYGPTKESLYPTHRSIVELDGRKDYPDE